MNLRQPMHPFVQNTLILVTSGIVASLVCAKVYGATLPLDEPAATPAADGSLIGNRESGIGGGTAVDSRKAARCRRLHPRACAATRTVTA